MHLTITYPTIPQRNTVRTSQVMDYFGIAHNASEQALVRDLDLPIQAGDVVLFTGASGSGKSSLLRAVAKNQQERLETRDESTEIVEPALDATEPQPSTLNPQPLEGLLNLASLQLPNLSLVDAIPLPFEDTLQLLALCGLAEAPLLLRTPRELSEGQRYRFSLALAVSLKPQWIIADEFTAVLDRTTAKVIAHNVRRIADRYGIGFLLATALDDVAEDLRPNLLVRCDLDGRFAVDRREESHERREPVESLSAAAPQPSTLNSQPLSKKKSPDLVPQRTLAQSRHQVRLAVFRSVALSQPPDRLDEVRSVALASRSANRNLPVCRPASLLATAKSVLRASGWLEPGDHAGAQSAACHIAAGRDSPDLSRRGIGLGICPARL